MKLTAKQIGEKTREFYPGSYKNMTDEEIGNKYLQNFGDVDDNWTGKVSQVLPTAPNMGNQFNENNGIEGAINSVGQNQLMGQNTQPGQSKGDFSGLNGDTLAQAILSLKAPITQRPNGGYSHKGYTAWDYGIPENTPLKAESDIQTEYIPNQGIYGNRILVTMPDGKKYYVSHLSKGKSGKYGAGQVYGYSGNTGKSSGPHVEIAPQ